MHSAPSVLYRCTRCARSHDRGSGLLCHTCQRVFVIEREFGFGDDDYSHVASRWDEGWDL
jgi:DNA-directed RNA polymerase subunit RPC12/RpoP